MQTYKEFIQEIDEEDTSTVLSSDSVSLILTHCNKTLLLKDKRWILPQGFIEILEDPLTACVRISEKKLGLPIDRHKLTALSAKLLDDGNKMYIYKYVCNKVESTNMIIDEMYEDSIWSTDSTIPDSFPKMYKQFI